MIKEAPSYAEVLLPLPLNSAFSYGIQEEMAQEIAVGHRVLVPFGSRKIYSGIVKRLHKEKPEYKEIKNILSLVDPRPLVTSLQLAFWDWLADYYMCTPGEVLRAALPSGLRIQSETRICSREDPEYHGKLSEEEEILLAAIEGSDGYTVQELEKKLKQENTLRHVHSLVKKGLLQTEEKLQRGYRPRMEKFLLIPEENRDEKRLHEILDSLIRAPRQLEAFQQILDGTGETSAAGGGIRRSDMQKLYGISAQTINEMVKKNIIHQQERKIAPYSVDVDQLMEPNSLSGHQQEALDRTRELFRKLQVVLLKGITSSGKTEIYIQLIREQMEMGKQVLYLLPEIALTAQLINRLASVFGKKMGVFHSRFSDHERIGTWFRVSGNYEDLVDCQVVLGVRSSVFLPFRNLGMVIVDEEHENTYKQYDPAPRYHARDAAVILAGMHRAKVLLGTATPSFESYFNACSGKYGLVELTERFRDMEMPEILLANTREAYRKKMMQSHFTPELIFQMKASLDEGQQVILFQNRRGFSSYIECMDCGWIPYCKNCDVSLTYHKQIQKMECHYCGYHEFVPGKCPDCGNTALETKGFGTEKLEEEVSILFPDKKVVRMDMDTTGTRKKYEKIIEDFETGKTHVLIGTQIISKGLDFDHVGLVGVMNADNMMNFPDFRAYERSYQLMAQVSGRAGRKGKRGKVVIQTSDPAHPLIQFIVNNDFEGFYREQAEERRAFNYPPSYRLLRITLKHKSAEKLAKASEDLARRMRDALADPVLGPQFPLVARTHNWYRKDILVKMPRTSNVPETKKQIRQLIAGLQAEKKYGYLLITPDVDPY